MLFFLTTLLAFTTLASALPRPDRDALSTRYYPQGTISSPANGTSIMPGASFAFEYNPRSDYCVYTHNFSVWLLTSAPSTIGGMITGMNGGDGESDGTGPSGYYFGRYSYSSYSKLFVAFRLRHGRRCVVVAPRGTLLPPYL